MKRFVDGTTTPVELEASSIKELPGSIPPEAYDPYMETAPGDFAFQTLDFSDGTERIFMEIDQAGQNIAHTASLVQPFPFQGIYDLFSGNNNQESQPSAGESLGGKIISDNPELRVPASGSSEVTENNESPETTNVHKRRRPSFSSTSSQNHTCRNFSRNEAGVIHPDPNLGFEVTDISGGFPQQASHQEERPPRKSRKTEEELDQLVDAFQWGEEGDLNPNFPTDELADDWWTSRVAL